MKTRLTLLPCRSSLLPGESLPSLGARLEKLNFHLPGTLGWLCRRDAAITGNAMPPDDVARARRALTYSQLTALTGLDPSVLFTASDHRFAPVLVTSTRGQEYITLPSGDNVLLVDGYTCRQRIRSAQSAQFCPLCLQEAAYHRLCWTPFAAAICLKHLCLLVNQCPCCGKHVAVAEIVETQCKVCGADLSKAPVVSVAGNSLGIMSQQFIQFWLTVAPEPQECTLSELPPAAWYRLVDGIRLNLLTHQDNWLKLLDPLGDLPKLTQVKISHLSALSPLASYHLYRMAFRAVLDWPHGFYGFLDTCRKNLGDAIGLRGLFGELLTHWIGQAWQAPEFEFVQSAFADYVFSGRIPLVSVLRHGYFRNDVRLIERYGLLSRGQAAQVLGVSEWAVSSLARSGRLRPARISIAGTGLVFLRQAVVAETAQAWDNGLPIGDVRCWLDVSEKTLEALLKARMLRQHPGSRQDDDLTNWRFDKAAVCGFVSALTSKLSPGTPSRRISLAEVLTDWQNPPVSQAELLKLIVDGQLPGYKSPRWDESLSRMYFEQAEVDAVLQAAVARYGWISDEEIAQQIGVSFNALYPLWHKYSRYYKLEPVAVFRVNLWYTIGYFEAQVAHEFCANCMTTSETARVLGVSETTLLRCVRVGQINALIDPDYDQEARYLFWRGEIAYYRGLLRKWKRTCKRH